MFCLERAFFKDLGLDLGGIGACFGELFGLKTPSGANKLFFKKHSKTLCFSIKHKSRRAENRDILATWGDFFDFRNANRFFHRFLRLKVRKWSSFGLHCGLKMR